MTGELVFRREGVLVQARRQDRLHAGVLEVVETQGQGVFITWERDTEGTSERVIINDQVRVIIIVTCPLSSPLTSGPGGDVCGLPPERGLGGDQ